MALSETLKSFIFHRMKTHFSPRELARALGVSESSLKRWADDGRLAVQRTAGGHRRIPAGEAVRFIRGTGLPLRHPAVLALENVVESAAVPPPEAAPAGEACDRLFDLLVGDTSEAARGYLVSLYLAGWPVATICDGPIRNALTRIGALWHHDVSGIWVEHRATQVCLEALIELRALVPSPAPDAPLAIGCAPAGDPYLIPSRMCGLVLASVGFRDVDLGPDTPTEALIASIEQQRPALVWLARSLPPDTGPARSALDALREAVAAVGGVLVLGGRGAPRIPRTEDLFVGSTMAELAAFASGRLSR